MSFFFFFCTRTSVSDGRRDAQDQDFRLQEHFPDAGLFGALGGRGRRVLYGGVGRFRHFAGVRVSLLADRRPLRLAYRGDGQSRHDQSDHPAEVVRHSPSLRRDDKQYNFMILFEEKNV